MLHLRTITGGLFALWTILLLPLASCTSLNPPLYPAGKPLIPIVFQSNGADLAVAQISYFEKEPAYQKMLADLQATAEKDLKDGPYSIVNKQHSLPNIDPHDYVSLAPYFWPNPDTPNHLPYVRHDGERNPEINNYDAHPFSEMASHVYRLALAGYITDDHRYSDRAALLIRTWFFDPATRMNPNLQHAQFVQGVNEGRGTGIIESNRLFDVIDAVALLDYSQSSWSADDQAKMKAWIADYRTWMQTSENGKAEAAAANNHGSWYAAQLTAYSLFLGDDATARQTAEAVKQRIASQILPDGEQPLELARTKSFSYSAFNISALTLVANLAQRVDVDLWNFKTTDGRSLRAAIDFLAPYAAGQKPWQHQQIVPLAGTDLFVSLRRAAAAYRDPRYDQFANQVSQNQDNLRYPPTYASAK